MISAPWGWKHEALAILLSFALTSPFISGCAQFNRSAAPQAIKDSQNIIVLSSGWQLQDIAKVPQSGEEISKTRYSRSNWYKATVPGTVLTSLVNDGVYPEPLYGENNRPDKIPDSLCRTSYWYRTQVTVPRSFSAKRIWLNFEGINYMADVWVNGKSIGNIRGAFARGIFDITPLVKPGAIAAIAVLIKPPLNPANPLEQTVANGLGPNGGIMSHDGPTFICTQGWDWIPAIRDRDMGIWQKVTLSASGPVTVNDPYVVTDLPLPRTDSADVSIEATVSNVTDTPQKGVLSGRLGDIPFRSGPIVLEAHQKQLIRFTPQTTPQLHLQNPHLWWPNGFGEAYLYPLHLSFDINGESSDAKDLNVGIREITYAIPGSENLALVVNGVPVFAKGGNWGMDEAMKRIPRQRLEAQIRLHKEANYTIIRNWVGQSTSEDFYDLCDRYGILIWDEFFQPNPSDSGRTNRLDGSQDISDIPLYLANVREKILRFRNHPSIALWCGRNEGVPTPPEINDGNAAILKELNPDRLYQPSSTDGRGVRSGGPYAWRAPQAFYSGPGGGRGGRGARGAAPTTTNPATAPFALSGLFAPAALEPFKTEIGSASIPTLESIHAMMPEKDWNPIPLNDDWAEHDLARGNGQGSQYPQVLAARYGPFSNLAEFVRKAQLANYEAFRAMYEGRLAKMFNPSNAVITWMSNPAQPSFTWQIYSYDLEPFGSFFGVKKACEPVHIQMNQNDFHLMVINNTPKQLGGLTASVRVFNADASLKHEHQTPVTAAPSTATDLGAVEFPSDLSPVHFVKVELRDNQNHLVSDNFYWRGVQQDDLTALDGLPAAQLDGKIVRRDSGDKCLLDVTLSNPTKVIAVMAHIQLRREKSNQRVLPVYYSDNYVSLLSGESRTITIEAASSDLAGEKPLVVLDGWNVTTSNSDFGDARIAPNLDAQVNRPQLTSAR